MAPWFIIMVGGLFVLFMVLSDSRVLDIMGQRSSIIGSIEGEDISYQEFAQRVEQERQNLAQSGQELDESQMDAFRGQVWDLMINQKLVQEKMDEFNIIVTDEEVREALLGPNPPEFIKQYFRDSTGTFDRTAYDQAMLNPQNRDAVIQTEELVRQQRMQQKLQEYLSANIIVTESEIKRKFVEQRVEMSADYVFVSTAAIPDTAVQISESELKNFYNKNINDYKIEAQRKVKYVLFRKQASKGDSVGIKNNLEAIVNKVKEDTSTFKTYVEIYSDQPFSRDTLSLDKIPDGANQQLVNADPGEIVGPVLTYEGYVVYNFVNKIPAEEPSVRASHVLIKTQNADKESAKAKADSLYQLLSDGADFAEIATANSEDFGSAQKGGDLGWFGKGQMVKPFEDACFSGRVGVIQKPIETQFGYHIIKVTGRSDENYVVEKLVNQIQPSATTLDDIYNSANDFSYLADKNGFESEAELIGYDVVQSAAFQEEGNSIPGLGASMAMVKFAFDNSVGTISEVFRVPSGYAVCMVSEVIKPGSKPFEEVRKTVESAAKREKKLARTLELVKEIKSKLGETGDMMNAASIVPQAKYSTANKFNLNGTIPGVGREFAFSEYAVDAPLNVISDPIKGTRGSYLIRVKSRTEFDSTAFSIQRNSIRDNLLQQKKSTFFTDWLEELKADADITDNRHLFYR
ncbi:MAG: peptidylprolyl isomerase [Melioribacteraceae bacterium]|nr:peptidylprolyl isomerase [Melioribacteraceae bacterium]MCF8395166.1 peptidylprolyl isomerase [Melioribacteraceae bacterium]